MANHLDAEQDWSVTATVEDWHDHEYSKVDFDVEITELHSSDWLNVRDLDLEHTEFEHSHIHRMPSSELVKQHFPHLAPPPMAEEPLPILLWLGTLATVTALVIISYELLRYFVRANEATKDVKKKKNKEKEQKQITSTGPLPLIEALRSLCQTSHEIQTQNHATISFPQFQQPRSTVQSYVEKHHFELNRLAYSLYQHVNKHFDQFEAISSDPSWLQLEMAHEATQDDVQNRTRFRNHITYASGALDVIAEVNSRIDSIITALSHSHSLHPNSHANGRRAQKVHIEDRLDELHTQWGLSDVKVQFSLIRDALLRVQYVSSKGYIHELMARLRRAMENQNEFHLLECIVLLQELDLHHSAAFSEIHEAYCAAEALLSEVHKREDQNVRRAAQEKLLSDQSDMIDTFQAFSPREMNGSSKKQFSITDSAKNRPINTPIVPQTSSIPPANNNATHQMETSTEREGVDASVELDGILNECMDNLHIIEGLENVVNIVEPSAPSLNDYSGCAVSTNEAATTAARILSLDSTCLSPEQSHKHQHTNTSPTDNNYNINNNNTTLHAAEDSAKMITLTTIETTPLSPLNDTAKLISSQWAMEALRMRREAQSSVDSELRALKEKRKDKEQQARARARRSIEEREKEVRTAKLFLEGLDEQRKTRQVAETEQFQRQEKELQQEFAEQKKKQSTHDSRVYKLVCIAYVLVYLLVYTQYSVHTSGVFGLYGWFASAFRNSCQFLACDKHVVLVRSESLSRAVSTSIHDITGGVKPAAEPSFLPIDAPYTDNSASDTCSTEYLGNQPSLKLVSAYQSTYRTTTQYLNSLVTVPVSTYVLRYALSGYVGGADPLLSNPVTIPSATGSGVLYEVYNGGRCVLHVLFRTLPSIVLTKILSFLGMKKLSGWVAVFFTMLCFSDILVQMAVGPLLPLLMVLLVHTVLFQVVTVFDEYRLRWMLVIDKTGRKVDLRSVILYMVYPLVGLCVVYSAAAARYA